MGIKNPGVLIIDDDETAEQASSADEPSLAMDAIAIGVEAKLDSQRNRVINTVYPELSLEERIWEPEGTETKGLYEL